MIPHDLHNRLTYLRGVSPVTQTNADTAFVSQIIDMADLMALEFVIALGTLSDAGITTVVLMEEGDDSGLSDAAAVADADLLGTEVLASFIQSDDDAIKKIGYVGTKRYVRLTITPTGNAAGNIPIAVIAVGHPRLMGTAN